MLALCSAMVHIQSRPATHLICLHNLSVSGYCLHRAIYPFPEVKIQFLTMKHAPYTPPPSSVRHRLGLPAPPLPPPPHPSL